MTLAQQSIGQSVLLGCLALSAAILGASANPIWSLAPVAAALPISVGWFRMQVKLRRDQRLDQLPSANR